MGIKIHIKGTATRSDIVAPKVAEEDKESRPQKTWEITA